MASDNGREREGETREKEDSSKNFIDENDSQERRDKRMENRPATYCICER